MHKRNALRRISKFTLEQLPRVPVQSPSSGRILFELVKVIFVTISNLNTSVWLIR